MHAATRWTPHPRAPTDNGLIERFNRTLGEKHEKNEMEHFTQAGVVIDGAIHHYSHARLHSSSNFLRPVAYHRAGPERFWSSAGEIHDQD